MHLESVASCKASLQMKGGQQKEEVKGRKQSEKKYRHKRGGRWEGGKKRVKKIKFSRGKVENRREKSRSPSGRDAAMRGGSASLLPCPARLPRREEPIATCDCVGRGGGGLR